VLSISILFIRVDPWFFSPDRATGWETSITLSSRISNSCRRGSVDSDGPLAVMRIVSGGQTGADRGGLDAAIALGLEHGGWCPLGRLAEDGVIPPSYRLMETGDASYAGRTRQNVIDSDGTVLFTYGVPQGGSQLTAEVAAKIGKPLLHLDLAADDTADVVRLLRAWLLAHQIETLNVAGARESEAPGIGDAVRHCLATALGSGLFPAIS
jgi:hypothetical protein